MSKVASAPARFVLSPFPPPPRFGWRQHRPLFLQDKQNHRVSSVARREQLDFDLGLKDEWRQQPPLKGGKPVPVRWRCAPWGQIV